MKTMKVVLTVATGKMADLLDAVANVADKVEIMANTAVVAAMEADDDDDVPVVAVRSTRPTLRKTVTVIAEPRRTRLGGKVVYTPTGTAKYLRALVDSLNGVKTVKAFVLRDLVSNPQSSNAEIRARIAKTCAKNGVSVESVDNVIWKLVNDGVISKASAEV